jgi:hypothetical protein
MLNCKLVKFAIKYLGLLLNEKLLRVRDWDFLLEKVGHWIDPWHILFFVAARRLELTNSYFYSLLMFAMGSWIHG